jgi:hypothetical protein
MPRSPIDIANRSGFPLQIAAAHEVERRESAQGWKVLQTEYAWTNPFNERSGFIDLLVTNEMETLVLVIECKRTLDATWVFLCDSELQRNRRHCKSWVVASPGQTFKHYAWRDVALDPASPQSEYCAVHGQKDENPMLERIASTVISATEAIAEERRASESVSHKLPVMHFNVILTTANLTVVHVDPESVSLAEGTIPATAEATEVPFVRFRKQLASLAYKPPTDRPIGDKALAIAKENTILVVKADQLRRFLAQFEIDENSVNEFLF